MHICLDRVTKYHGYRREKPPLVTVCLFVDFDQFNCSLGISNTWICFFFAQNYYQKPETPTRPTPLSNCAIKLIFSLTTIVYIADFPFYYSISINLKRKPKKNF